MKRHINCFWLVAIFWLTAGSASSQTKWFKYEGNPVILPGASGLWDDGTVLPNRVIRQNSLLTMWYTGWAGYDNNVWRTGRATSPDGVTWTKSAENPVLGNGPAQWDAIGAFYPYVIRTETNYRMWYTGNDFNNSAYRDRIGYAESPDGIVWTKSSANPFLLPEALFPRGPLAPSVLGPDGTGGYKMWFQGGPLAHADFQIGYATALNETTWTIHTYPVLPYGSPGTWDDDKVMTPRVLLSGGKYEMWYCGEKSDGFTDIGYATSVDGIVWTRSGENPVLRRGPGWDANDMYCLEVLSDGNMYHMWYGGNATLLGWRIGYAVSPKGMTVNLTTSDTVINSIEDTVLVTVHVDDPTGFKFSAKFLSGSSPVDTMELFDDGAHGDTLAGDGIFANKWIPVGPGIYSVNLLLTLNDTLNFELKNAATNLTTGVSGEESLVPERIHLSQNYPNPFNPSTTIRFTLPTSLFTSLTIYNVLGQQVATLVNEKLDLGTHSVTWDATGFPSGVYFYKLQADSFIEARKLILMR